LKNTAVVVINPASANGNTGRRWPQLAARLRSRLDHFEVLFTNAPGHGTTLVRDAIESGARHIISVGGDGTHNEVVNGCMSDGKPLAQDLMLSVIPTGTGGDLRRTLGLPNSAVDAIDYVGHAPKRVDLGLLQCATDDEGPTTAYFINISSFGVSGLVVKMVNQSSKAMGGRASFLWGVVKGTFQYRNQPMRITLDPDTDQEVVLSGRYYNGVVANARYFGGGMHIAPNAVMNDGLFDVILIGDLSKRRVITGTPSIFSGTHLKLKDIVSHRARSVRAEALGDERVLIDLDGEQPGYLPATYTILPDCLSVCTGPEWIGA
jgi:diacylglycerol kinase (ATP)